MTAILVFAVPEFNREPGTGREARHRLARRRVAWGWGVLSLPEFFLTVGETIVRSMLLNRRSRTKDLDNDSEESMLSICQVVATGRCVDMGRGRAGYDPPLD